MTTLGRAVIKSFGDDGGEYKPYCLLLNCKRCIVSNASLAGKQSQFTTCRNNRPIIFQGSAGRCQILKIIWQLMSYL